MLVTIFVILIVISLIVLILGYITDDEIYFPVALTFLFLISIAILSGSIEYKTGSAEAVSYTYDNMTLSSTNSSIIDVYSSWDDGTSHTVGWILAVMSFAGFVLSLVMMRRRKVEDL